MTEDEAVQKIAEIVYRKKLAESAGGSTEWRLLEADRMIEKDGDGGAKFRRRAQAYSSTIRMVLAAQKEIGYVA